MVGILIYKNGAAVWGDCDRSWHFGDRCFKNPFLEQGEPHRAGKPGPLRRQDLPQQICRHDRGHRGHFHPQSLRGQPNLQIHTGRVLLDHRRLQWRWILLLRHRHARGRRDRKGQWTLRWGLLECGWEGWADRTGYFACWGLWGLYLGGTRWLGTADQRHGALEVEDLGQCWGCRAEWAVG